MRAFIGQYFKTKEQAFKAYNNYSEELRKLKSVVAINGVVFIIGNNQLKKLVGEKVEVL